MTVQNPQQSSGQQIIQLQQAQQTPTTQTGGIQIVQQIVTPSGEIQQIPVRAFIIEIEEEPLLSTYVFKFMLYFRYN